MYSTKEKAKEYQRKWYLKSKNAKLTKNKKRKQDIRDWFREYKKTLQCSVCPESDPRCLDFHHKDPNDKTFGVSECILRGFSIENIQKEIDKCSVLCANCHRKITHAEF